MARGYRSIDVDEASLAALRDRDVRQLIREAGVPAHKLLSLIRALQAGLHAEIPAMNPPPGLEPALSALRVAGINLGLVTSNSRDNIDLFLQRHRWQGWFDYIETGSSLFGKSRLIRRVLDRARLPPERVAYVGDEERDVQAARRAGVLAVAVAWGFHQSSRLAACQPDHLIDAPQQLPPLFLQP